MLRSLKVHGRAAALAALCLTGPARAQSAPGSGATLNESLRGLTFNLQADETGRVAMEATELDKSPNPFSFSITYYLYSDYIFRGIDFSEYDREARERLNHQMTTDISVDIGTLFGAGEGACGTFSFGTFFEWFAGQKSIAPDFGGQNLQEVDYVLGWSYDVEPLTTTLSLGFTFYAYPNASSINTQEWSIGLEHNDAWMWKWLLPDNEDGVLNPSFMYVQDVGIADGGSWMELGISHDFPLAKNLTLTPSALLAIDHRYLDPLVGTGRSGTTRLAYWQAGVAATYDLTPALQLPDWAGSMETSGFLYFNDALGTAESDQTIQNEFFGGVSIGWSF